MSYHIPPDPDHGTCAVQSLGAKKRKEESLRDTLLYCLSLLVLVLMLVDQRPAAVGQRSFSLCALNQALVRTSPKRQSESPLESLTAAFPIL